MPFTIRSLSEYVLEPWSGPLLAPDRDAVETRLKTFTVDEGFLFGRAVVDAEALNSGPRALIIEMAKTQEAMFERIYQMHGQGD